MLAALIVAAVFGAFIGSFCNVVIHRMPRNESVVTPPSRCYACGTRVCWYDNIPVLSWLLLRGRCRHCGTSFSVRYLFGELAVAGITAVAVWLAFAELPTRSAPVWTTAMGWDSQLVMVSAGVAVCVMAWWLWVTSAIDLAHTVIPDELTKPLQVLAPGLAVFAAVGRDLGWQADGWAVVARGPDVLAAPWQGLTTALWWIVPILIFLGLSVPWARWIYTKCLPNAEWREEDLRGLRVGVWWFMGATVVHVLALVVITAVAAGADVRELHYGALVLATGQFIGQNFDPALGAHAQPIAVPGAGWLLLQAQLTTSILGSLTGWLVLYVVGLVGTMALKRYALGFGDVKLLAPLGAFLGPVGIGYAFALSAVVGTVVGVPWRLLGGGREIPFGPFLAVGSVLAVFFGPQIHAFLFPQLASAH